MRYLTGSGVLRLLRSVAECCKSRNALLKVIIEMYVIHYHFANMLNFYDKQYDFYTPQGFLFVMVSFISMSAVTFCIIWIMKKVKILNLLFFGKKS